MQLESYFFSENISDENDLIIHFLNVDKFFVPPLSSYVNISSYSNKLFQNSHRFECWYMGQLIGLVAMYTNYENSPCSFISNVSVFESHANKGISFKLMSTAIEFVKHKDMTKIELYVDSQNIRAINFYKKLDFKIIREESGKILMAIIF